MSKINAVELYTKNEITLYDVNGVVMTTTESIAMKFSKDMKDVNKKLKTFPDYTKRLSDGKIALTEISAFERANGISSVTHIDRDTMTLLVMGFTGNKAFEWKKQYIEAFNLMEKQSCKPIEHKLSFNQHKMQMINEVATEAIREIGKLENDTVKSLPQPTEEVEEALLILEDRKEVKKLKKSYKKNVDSKYYNLKVTHLHTIKADAPRNYKVRFEYYCENQTIMTALSTGNTYKVSTPQWLRSQGEFLPFSCVVTLRKTNKRGFLDLVKYID